MHDLPNAALAHEHIGGDELGSADVLRARHERAVAHHERGRFGAADRRRLFAGHDRLPARHHLVATDQDVPPRVNTRHMVQGCPDVPHTRKIPGQKSIVKSLVGAEHLVFDARHRMEA